jgi:hypothetical protein
MIPMAMSMIPMIPAGFTTIDPLESECAPALDQFDNENDHGDDEQDVNEAAEGIRANKAKKPKHEQNHEYSPEHRFP